MVRAGRSPDRISRSVHVISPLGAEKEAPASRSGASARTVISADAMRRCERPIKPFGTPSQR